MNTPLPQVLDPPLSSEGYRERDKCVTHSKLCNNTVTRPAQWEPATVCEYRTSWSLGVWM